MSWSKRIISGLGIGAFVFLLIIFVNKKVEVTSSSVITVFALSIFISITSVVFDVDRLNFIQALCIHYLVVLIVILLGVMLISSEKSYLSSFTSTTIIYIVSYGITIIKMKVTAHKYNEYLLKLKKESKV